MDEYLLHKIQLITSDCNNYFLFYDEIITLWPLWILSSAWGHTSLNTCYFLIICLCSVFLPQVSVFVLFCLEFTCLKRWPSSSNLNFLFSIQLSQWFVSWCKRIKPSLTGRNSSWWSTTLLGFLISFCLLCLCQNNLFCFCLFFLGGGGGRGQSQESPGVLCNQKKPGPQPFANLFFHW